jgi:heptosyltransferase-2/heptosyltransferase-3
VSAASSHSDSGGRIAIVKPCCIGDCVMALPAIDSVIQDGRYGQVDIYVGSHSRAVFQTRATTTLCAMPDTFDARGALRLGVHLRRRRYDAIAVLDRSRLLRVAGRIGSKRYATAQSREIDERHESQVYLDAIGRLGITTSCRSPMIRPPDPSDARGLFPDNGGEFIVLHPGGADNPGTRMLSKRWPEERWVELAHALSSLRRHILVSGGPSEDERRLCGRIAAEARLAPDRVLAGRASLRQMMAVVGQAALFVGPDTGMSHIAAAIGVPTVAIFGPTNPTRYQPLGARVRVVAAPGSASVFTSDLRRAHTIPANAAISLVGVDAVLEACQQVIEDVT